MFENKNQPVINKRHFYRRLTRSFGFGLGLIVFSLSMGMIGYGTFEHMSVIDAFLNASMIMAGMGPVATLQTSAGKVFAGIYALYCGLALITAAAVILSPIVHRFFHKFHVEDEKN
jgi:hypothetical protein